MTVAWEHKGRTFEASDDDLLWLGRAVDGEVVPGDAVDAHACASVLVRRWVLRGSGSLAATVRGFSQPVNPRWARGGDLAEANPSRATERMLRDREVATTKRWDELRTETRAAVERVVRGDLGAPTAINWAGPVLYRPHGLDTSSMAARLSTAPGAVQSRERARGEVDPVYVHVSGASVRGNVFFSTAASRAAGTITVPGRGSPMVWAGIVLAVVAGVLP